MDKEEMVPNKRNNRWNIARNVYTCTSGMKIDVCTYKKVK